MRKVKIYGERRTGTNALTHNLKVNFPEIEFAFPNDWKHGFPLKELDPDVFYIFTVRNPVTWIESFCRTPHHNGHLFRTPISKALFMRVRDNEGESLDFENLVDLWNQKNKAYLEASKAENAMLVYFEGRGAAYDYVLRRIGQEIGMTPNEPLKIEHRRVAATGEVLNIRNKIKMDYNHIWKRLFNSTARALISGEIDKDLMNKLKYKLCGK